MTELTLTILLFLSSYVSLVRYTFEHKCYTPSNVKLSKWQMSWKLGSRQPRRRVTCLHNRVLEDEWAQWLLTCSEKAAGTHVMDSWVDEHFLWFRGSSVCVLLCLLSPFDNPWGIHTKQTCSIVVGSLISSQTSLQYIVLYWCCGILIACWEKEKIEKALLENLILLNIKIDMDTLIWWIITLVGCLVPFT